jgi:hypothetical protein
MRPFKSLFPEHYILKRNNLITNAHVSAWADIFSLEEGGGFLIDYFGDGCGLSVCMKVSKVCDPELVNRRSRRFNRT